MTCATCGAAHGMDESEGATEDGEFKEEYSCVNGHWGVIEGDAGDPGESWDYRGPVFEERGVA